MDGRYAEWQPRFDIWPGVIELDKREESYRHRRLNRIRENSVKCMDRMESRAGWNEMVHSPLIELALEQFQYGMGLTFRNV